MLEKIFKYMDYTLLDETLNIEQYQNKLLTMIENLKELNHLNGQKVASLCVFPEHIKFLKTEIDLVEFLKNNIKLAAVINFPGGKDTLEKIEDDTKKAIDNGANEIDFVFNYTDYLNKGVNYKESLHLIKKITKESGAVLKIIIESGELTKSQAYEVSRYLIENHEPDFIKTSTGKTNKGANHDSAQAILTAIFDLGRNVIYNDKKIIGLKVSGGIKTQKDALGYIYQAEEYFTELTPKIFRIGASSLFDELMSEISNKKHFKFN